MIACVIFLPPLVNPPSPALPLAPHTGAGGGGHGWRGEQMAGRVTSVARLSDCPAPLFLLTGLPPSSCFLLPAGRGCPDKGGWQRRGAARAARGSPGSSPPAKRAEPAHPIPAILGVVFTFWGRRYRAKHVGKPHLATNSAPPACVLAAGDGRIYLICFSQCLLSFPYCC